jgi:glucose uptake protein GlcU
MPALSMRLSVFTTALVLQEFFVVVASTYLASALYQVIAFQEWPTTRLYVTSALFVGFVVIAISFTGGRYLNLQRQARHAFLWSGVGAIIAQWPTPVCSRRLRKVFSKQGAWF